MKQTWRKIVNGYYRFQTYVDIGWGEFSWFNDSLVELMAVLYILEKVNIIIEGNMVYALLAGAFIGAFGFGYLLKRIGVYDQSQYIDAEIDPVSKINLEASKLIIEYFNKQKEQR
jgi:hypothetical protein